MADMQTRILEALRTARKPLDDDELARVLGVVRQQVNQAARILAERKQTIRYHGRSGKLVNAINDRAALPEPSDSENAEVVPADREGRLSEDEVKRAVVDRLKAEGWTVEVAWGRSPGIDIEARRGDERLVIEAKGEVALQPQQHNYFVGALGELVQRLDDPNARYGLALPNHRQYHGLVDRLPEEAKKRLNFVVYWVERGPEGVRVTDSPPPGKRTPAW